MTVHEDNQPTFIRNGLCTDWSPYRSNCFLLFLQVHSTLLILSTTHFQIIAKTMIGTPSLSHKLVSQRTRIRFTTTRSECKPSSKLVASWESVLSKNPFLFCLKKSHNNITVRGWHKLLKTLWFSYLFAVQAGAYRFHKSQYTF